MRQLFLSGVTPPPLSSCAMNTVSKLYSTYPHPPHFRKKENYRDREIRDDIPISDKRYPCECTITLYKPIIFPPRFALALPCIYTPSDS